MTERFPHHDAALAATVNALTEGERDVSDLIETTCDRIDAIDNRLQAFRDEPRRRRRLRQAIKTVDHGQLAGVPVGIKDIIHVNGFETQAGSVLPPELFDGPEATLVKRLQTAGGLIAGKTRTTEFAGFAPARTRNPRAPGHTPGGSSSGSAAAVAAGLVPLAIGTQTGGSVIRPAAFCGVVGYKPSFGRIPTDGVLTRAWSLDTVGTFTQDLAGARL
ncbi:MAG: amidase family protein, partial [Salinarchaeum sp.]